MGGRIFVKTAPGRGSRFTVSVPVQLAAAAPSEAEQQLALQAAKPAECRPSSWSVPPLERAPVRPRRHSLGDTEAHPSAPLTPSAWLAPLPVPVPRRCRVLLVGASLHEGRCSFCTTCRR
jgi:hypothetical protein